MEVFRPIPVSSSLLSKVSSWGCYLANSTDDDPIRKCSYGAPQISGTDRNGNTKMSTILVDKEIELCFGICPYVILIGPHVCHFWFAPPRRSKFRAGLEPGPFSLWPGTYRQAHKPTSSPFCYDFYILK